MDFQNISQQIWISEKVNNKQNVGYIAIIESKTFT